ncbi:MAG: dipeptidase [Rhodothermaceae bacterium]
MERRNFLSKLGYAAIGSALLPSVLTGGSFSNNKETQSEKQVSSNVKKYSPQVRKLVEEAVCIDMLGTYGDSFHYRNGIPLEQLWESIPDSFTEEDFLFVKNAGINVFGWGSMMPEYEDMLRFMALQNGIIASNPEYFERIDTKEKLDNIANSSKIGMLIANQNSKHFRTEDDVDLFYALGQRISQITYNGKNNLGCGAFEDVDTGLTDYGKKIIKRMNSVGMGVDVSHCGDKTTMECIAASDKPVLITHGSCRSIAKGVARAKTDESIKAVAKTGGVVGIPILRFMIKEKEPVFIDDFLNHIDHVAQIAGIEHVGIGSDQGLYTEDYGTKEWRKSRLENAPAKYQTHTNEDYLLTIEKLNHPFRTYDIAEGLLKIGYTDTQIKMVLGENFKRALKEIFKH